MNDVQTRIGYDLILKEIPEKSRVLDLGCGDGTLLHELQKAKNVDAYGVEISSEGLSMCLEKGLYCYQGDIDEGLSDYKDNSFDYVILNQTLQDIKRPQYVIKEIMRICLNTIISFPNLGNLRNRLHFMFMGKMAKNRLIQYNWYDSANIHPLSIRDFSIFCKINKYPIIEETHFSLDSKGKSRNTGLFPNLYAEYGYFILDGRSFTSETPEGSSSN